MEVSEAKKSQWKSDEELTALGARDVRARTVAVAKPVAAARVAWRFLEGASHSMAAQGHGWQDIGQDRQQPKRPTQATAAGRKGLQASAHERQTRASERWGMSGHRKSEEEASQG